MRSTLAFGTLALESTLSREAPTLFGMQRVQAVELRLKEPLNFANTSVCVLP
ncbi:hypothetical protein Cylst_5665 [Cylindrospermum stagnale PCC 7417]|uniref:Uncharacterized protein n=1 Tax=Cylindrospermum stagnale PCC 7417 TaxID=56107 RepID=K9X4R9_9NOST|nr:hypothetical protein Cylst_5665 [Cylindrospermum stagnale PCC 7417]